MKQDLYTIQEASVILGISSKTLRRWEETGKIKPIRTGGNQRRYKIADIKKLEKRLLLRRGKRYSRKQSATVTLLPEPSVNNFGTEQQQEEQSLGSEYLTLVKSVEQVQETAPQTYSQETVPVVNNSHTHFEVQEQEEESSPVIPEFNEPQSETPVKHMILPVFGAAVMMVVVFGGLLLWRQLEFPGMHSKKLAVYTSSEVGPSKQVVLAANTQVPVYQLEVNIPTLFGEKTTFLSSADIKKGLSVAGQSVLTGGIKTNNADINAGKGKITASNVLYSIVAGSNITISGDKQNPTISATGGVSSIQGANGAVNLISGSGISLNGLAISNSGVLSVGGVTGDVTLTGGTGISVSGTTITNSGVTSFQGSTGVINLTAGSGISISGTTITNSDKGSSQNIFKNFIVGSTNISAGSNNDTVTFASGSGIILSGNPNNKTITITSNASGTLAGLNTNGVLYGIDSTHAGSTLAGATGTVLHGITAGVPVFSAVDLTADVVNNLPIGNGGTGVGSTPNNGEVLIGNGSGYSLSTITAGSGIGITNGAGTITVLNSGVLDLTGTANQVDLTGSTGSITISLPQDINTSSTPSFASLKLTAATNQLVLGSGNTGTITTASLTTGQTYTLPNGSGTFCLQELNNCAGGGGGGGISGTGTPNYIVKFATSSGVEDSSIYDNGQVGIGTTSPQGLFSVSGTVTGQALVNFNQTGDQSILVGSVSGTTRFVFDNAGDLNIIGGGYEIGGNSVLSSNTLGSGITASSLTSVGALTTGSITSGFGNIDNGVNSISGGDITAIGTTGYKSTGAGAGIVFSGTGNHIISASTGTLELGSVTLTGTVAGGGNNITGLGTINGLAITANSGTITTGTWNANAIGAAYGGTGVDTSTSTGVPYISSGTWNVDTNALSAIHGGTGVTGYTAGDLLYANTTTTLNKLGIGTPGQVLSVSGSNIPQWVNTGGAINFWQNNSNAIAPYDITDDFLLGGISTNSAKFAFVNNSPGSGTPTASISGSTANNSLYITGDGTLATTNKQSLVLGSATSGNVDIYGFTTGILRSDNNGVITAGKVNVGSSSEVTGVLSATNGGTGIDASAATNGELLIGNQSGGGYTLTTLTQGAGIIITNGPGSITIAQNASSVSKWTQDTGNGVLYPNLSPLDVLFGGTSTASAKFAFINNAVGSGIPTASISGNTANNALYLTGNGTLGTVNKSTMTLGSATTGNINLFNFGAGALQTDASGNILTGNLSAAYGGTGQNGSSAANGTLLIGNGSGYSLSTLSAGSGIQISNGSGTITISQLGSGSSKWTQDAGNGVLYPNLSSLDVLFGGTSTASAKFAFINNSPGSGTPTASISGSTSNNALYLSGDGALGTANKGTLTLGTATTGNINLYNFGAGAVQTDANGNLLTGTLSVGNGGTGLTSVADGSLIYGSGGSTLTELSISGKSGDCLIAGASVPSWQACPGSGSGSSKWTQTGNFTYPISTGTQIGIGTTTTGDIASEFYVTRTLSDGILGKALAIFNQTESQDILTASSSGTPEFTVGQNGELAIGGSAINASNYITAPNFSVTTSGGITAATSSTINGLNISSGTISGGATWQGNLISAQYGGTGQNGVSAANGALLIGNGSGYSLSTLTAGSGVQITNGAGTITISQTGSGASKWTQDTGNGVLYPNLSPLDVLFGGTSTASAKFAFINNAAGSGTPTASISGSTANNALYLTGNGVLATTDRETLGLGGGGTGAITLQDQRLASPVSLTQTATALDAGLGTTGIIDAINKAYETITGDWALSSNVLFPTAKATQIGIGIASSAPAISSLYVTRDESGSGALGKALAIFNQTESEDILTASSSGVTKFTVDKNGYLAIGGSAINTSNSLTGPGFAINTSGQITADTTSTINGLNISSGTISGGAAWQGNVITAQYGGTGQNGSSAANGALLIGNGSGYSLSTLTAGSGVQITNGSGTITISQTGSGASKWTQDTGNGVLYPNLSPLDVLFGGTSTASAKFAFINNAAGSGTPTASISGSTANNALYLTGNGTLGTANKSTLTLGSASTGNINLYNFGAGALQTDLNGNLTTGTLTTANGGTGITTYAKGALLVGSNSGGTLTALGIGSAGQILEVVGGTAQWQNPGGVINFWQEASGALSPLNISDDLLLGGSATTSAKFAFINNAPGSGTPTASISAQDGTNAALVLDANSSIQSVRNQTLTIGGSTTGDIVLSPLNGTGLTTSNGTFNLATTGDTFQINNQDVLTSSTLGSNVVNSSLTKVGALTSGSIASGFGSIDVGSNSISGGSLTASGTITFDNGSFKTDNAVLYTDSATGQVGVVTATSNGNECLLSGSGTNAPLWGSCALGQNYFQLNSGALSPFSNTADLLLGGTATNSAKFAILNMAGGTPEASVTGNFVVMPYTSGANEFGGYVGIGTNAPALALDVNAGSVVNGGERISGSSSDVGLQLNNTSAGVGWILDSAGTGSFYGTGNLSLYQVGLGGNPGMTLVNPANFSGGGYSLRVNPIIGFPPQATLDINNGNGTLSTASISGKTSYAGLVVDNSGVGDLFTASKSGLPKFTVLNNGNLQLANYTANGGVLYTGATGVVGQSATGNSGQVLQLNGSHVPTWVNASTVGVNYWQEASGAVSPLNLSDDLLLGSTSTNSAKIAFINIAAGSGTPTASISGSIANNALYLNGDGTIGTTDKQSLTLGSAATGNIVVNGLSGSNSILYTQSGTGVLSAATTGVNSLCLLSSAGGPSWQNCPGSGSGGSKWTQDGLNGVLYPDIQSLDVLFGGTSTASAKFAFTGNAGTVTPVASIAATPSSGVTNGLALSGNGSIQSLNNNTLTIGGSTTGNIAFNPGNVGAGGSLYLRSNGWVGIGTAAPGAALDVNGNLLLAANGTIDARSAGGLTIGGGTNTSSLTLGKSTASIVLPNYNNCGMLSTSGTTLSCSALPASNGYFQLNTNALSPGNTSYDLLLGGSATTSAKFAFINNAGVATPVASIAATPSSGTTSGLSLSGTGAIQSLNMNTLTLGGTTTGKIVIHPGSGTTQIDSNIISLTGSGTGPIIDATSNVLSLDTLNNQAITTGTGLTTLGGNLQIDGGNIRDGSANTRITLGTAGNVLISANSPTGNGAFIVNNTSSGDLFDASNSGTTKFQINNNGDILLSGTTTLSNAGVATLTGLSSSGNITFSGLGTNNESSVLYLNNSNQLALASTTVTNQQCLLSSGASTGSPTWGNCTNYWQLNNNALSPSNNTYDLLLGGTATTSAKFAVLNMAGGTPEASVAGNFVVMPYTSGTNELGGNVGIGTTNPSYPLSVATAAPDVSNGRIIDISGNLASSTNYQYGIYSSPNVVPGSASSKNYTGGIFIPASSSNNLNTAGLIGLEGSTYYSGTGTVGDETGGYFQNQLVAAGTITNSYGVYIDNPNKSAGTITTNYGLYVNSQTAGATNYAAVFDGGNVGIGTTNPPSTLTVNGTAPNANNGAIAYIEGSLSSTTASTQQEGIRSFPTINVSGTTTNSYFGGVFGTYATDATNLTGASMIGVQGAPYFNATSGSVGDEIALYGAPFNANVGTVSNAWGVYVQAFNSSTGTITNNYGMEIAAPSNSGTITNKYGLIVDPGAGNVGIGTTNPQGILDVASNATSAPSDFILNQTGSTNLVFNPSFETGTTNWSLQQGGTGGSIAQSSAQSLFGSKSLLVTTGTSYTNALYPESVTGNTTYTFSVWVKSSYSGTVFTVFDNGNSTNNNSGYYNGTGQWQRFTLTYTTNSAATQIQFKLDGLGSSGNTAYFDGVQMEQSSSVSPYFDGSFGPGYYWTGTPNNSSSVRTAGAAFAYQTINSAGGLGAASRSNFPTLQIDQNGSGDLFTASQSGLTKFVINASGDVGIGNAAPSNPLDIYSTGEAIMRLQGVGDAFNYAGIVMSTTGTTKTWNILNRSETGQTNNFDIQEFNGTTTSDRFTIAPGGNVGIGTTSPVAPLVVNGAYGSNAAAIVNQNNSGNIFVASESGVAKFTVLNNGNIQLANYTSCGSLTTDASGNVICGSASGQKLLETYTISAPAGTNLHAVFTGSNNASVSSSSGTLTFPANASAIEVKLKGAGGGGGGAGATVAGGSGGGEGGYSQKLITSLGTDYYIKVGGGGAGGSTSGGNGGTGTATCIGTNSSNACTSPLASATGGSGGGGTTSGAVGGAGGTGTNGDLNQTGQAGDYSGGSAGGTGGGIGGGLGATSGTGGSGSNGGGGGSTYDNNGGSTGAGGNGGNGYIIFYVYTSTSAAANYWQLNNGVLAPSTLTDTLTIGGPTNTSSLATVDIRNLNGTEATASVSGATSFAGLVVDQSGVGDLFTASKSGATKFVITNSGNVGIGTSTPGNDTLVVNQPNSSGDIFSASQSGNTKFVINNAGSVGIGTTTPGELLDIYSAGTYGTGAQIETPGTGVTQQSYLALVTKSDGTQLGSSTNSGWQIGARGNAFSEDQNDLFTAYWNGNSWANTSLVISPSSNVGIGTDAMGNGALAINQPNSSGDIFSASQSGNTEFVINNAGKVGIGTSNPTRTLDIEAATSGQSPLWVENTTNSSGDHGEVVKLDYTGTPGTSNYFVSFQNSTGSTIGDISGNGSGGVAYNQTSDLRLKENILPTHYSLADLMKVQVDDYDFISAGVPTTGIIAQQLYNIYPSAVHVGGADPQTNPWGIDYGDLTPLIIKGVQDEQTEIQGIKDIVNLTDLGNTTIYNQSPTDDPLFNTYDVKDTNGNDISRVGAFVKAVIGNLTAGKVAANDIILRGRSVNDRLDSLDQMASSSANTVTSLSSTVDQLTSKYASLEAELANVQITPTTDSTNSFQVQNGTGTSSLVLSAATTQPVANSDIEQPLDLEWTPEGNATISRITTEHHSGMYALQVTDSAAGDGVKNTLITTLSPSTTYTLYWYIKSGSTIPNNSLTAAYSYDGADDHQTAACGPLTPTTDVMTNGWQLYSCQFTTTQISPTASNAIIIKQTDMTLRTFYLDDVQLEKASDTTLVSDSSLQLIGASPSASIASPSAVTITKQPESSSSQYTVTTNSGQVITNTAVYSEAAVGNLKTGGIDAQNINTLSLILAGQSVSDRLNALENTASSEAELSHKVDTLSSSMTQLKDQVASLEATFNLLASGSALLNSTSSFTASSASQLGLDQLSANDATIDNSLTVLGQTTVADLGVTGRMTVGLLGINGLDQSSGGGQAYASINTSSGPLMFQSQDLNGVNFENGKLTIDTGGNLKTKASITAKTINADKLNVTEDTSTASSPSNVLSTSAGKVVIPAGQTSIDVSTSALTSKSLIFVTPQIPVQIGAQAISSNTFRISIDKAAASDLQVNWWIVN